MDTIDAARCALVLVDYQARLMPAIFGADEVVRCAVQLASGARALGLPVIGTEQNRQGLGPNVDEVAARCDRTVAKRHFDACEDGLCTTLDELAPRARQVVVGGCEAHVCLLQTALGLLRHERRVWVVEAACGSRRGADHRLAMQRLQQAGATLVSPEMVLFEWMRSSQHPQFRQMLEIVKQVPVERR
ncbi:MAG: isochorismatase family protein [Burkholderiaceae bacterium]|nr:isochorismatase family protein [Burkholderiaceae bacterium]